MVKISNRIIRRKALLIVVILIFNTVFCISQNSFFVKSDYYEGYILKKESYAKTFNKKMNKRYTPTIEDVAIVEQQLKDSIDIYLNNYLNNEQKKYISISSKTISKYKRQYVGYKDENDNKYVWIQMIKDSEWEEISNRKDISKEVVYGRDGGDYYWEVLFDIKNRRLVWLYIQGEA